MPPTNEPPLDAQINAVRAGESDEIQIEQSPLSDKDLVQLRELDKLRALLIDHPDSHFSSAGLGHLADVPHLRHLRIRGQGIDDAALAEISKISGLEILNVPHASFSDSGLTDLKMLPQLIQLRFGTPHVTDHGMNELAGFPSLKRLHLIDVPITDRGLQTLAAMMQLESLYIDGADISDAAFDELFKSRPDLHVHVNQQHHDRDLNKHH